MLRTSKHILKFANKTKQDLLSQAFSDYKNLLSYYIQLIKTEDLPLQTFVTSKYLPNYSNIDQAYWKVTAYNQSSRLIRAQLKSLQQRRFKRYQKVYTYFKSRNRQIEFTAKRFAELQLNSILHDVIIDIKNITIELDKKYIHFSTDSIHFDEFVDLILPYRRSDFPSRFQHIRLSFNHHKHSKKYISWVRKNTCFLSYINDNFYLSLVYERSLPSKKTVGNEIGIDIGYKKLIIDSNNNDYGSKELELIYKRLANKQRGSKNYQQSIIYKKEKVNQICNKIDYNSLKTIVIEDLKNVKKDSKKKIYKKVMNKMQYWSYLQTIKKIEMLCEEQGVSLVKVSPAYTSMTCSNCGNTDKQSRNGEVYYCIICNYIIDADHNAAINILRKGVYHSSNKISL